MRYNIKPVAFFFPLTMSLDFLQAQGIIPHIHTTVVLELPSGSKRRREQASDDVCREKFRRYDGERVKAEVSEAIAITGMDEINRLEVIAINSPNNVDSLTHSLRHNKRKSSVASTG